MFSKELVSNWVFIDFLQNKIIYIFIRPNHHVGEVAKVSA